MLGNNDVTDAILFKDIEPAQKLYEGALGSQQIWTEESGDLAYKREISRVLAGESKYAHSGKATSAT